MRSTAALLALLPAALGAPLLKARSGTPIPNAYIVVLKNSAEFGISSVDDIIGDVEKSHTYTGAPGFTGFAATLNETQLEALKASPAVDFIEQDSILSINALTSQTGADWGLARLSSTTTGSTTYIYDSTAGAGTCAYVVDTGIYTAHSEFGGRASFLANYADSSNTDGHGHGTHVAGTIGGTTYGVAKKTTLYAVKVLNSNGSGTASGVISGMNFVVTDAPSRNCPNGVVVNMSLGGDKSASINAAAKAINDAGHFLAVAAGNDAEDTDLHSPSSEPSVCTVGATTSTDAMASYSNFGATVDVFAPGSSIKSAWNTGVNAVNTISGTSMASPHVAGLGAYLLGLQGSMTGTALCDLIKSTALTGKITGLPSGTANRLANNGAA